MVGLKCSLPFLMCVSAAAIALDTNQLELSNGLAGCSELKGFYILDNSPVPVIAVDVVLKKSIAECGCKSALGTFSVYADRGDYSSYLLGGKINLAVPGEKYLPLATDVKLLKSAKIEVTFACAQPD